ncbi:MAG: glutaredoxin domain-containing protein [Actinomycetota bacterium]
MTTIETIDFYWRPGCPFCIRLERALDTANVPMTKRNIWDDPDAAAFVRSVADGNETVPTVTVGDRSFVNPAPQDLAKVLEEAAPHLLRQA